MNEHSWITVLNQIGVEQLSGIAISSTLLCVCGRLLLWMARRQSAAVRFSLWQATGSAIMLTAVVLFAAPGIPLQTPPEPQSTELGTASLEPNNSSATSWGPQHELLTDRMSDGLVDASDGGLADFTPTDRPEFDPVFSELPVTNKDVVEVAAASIETVSNASSTVPMIAVLAVIWFAVLLCFLLSFILSAIRCRSIAANADRDIPDHVSQAALAACERLGRNACPELRLTDQSPVPFTTGLFRPIVVLPTAAVGWTTDKLCMVMAHEIAHVERRDILWHWIGRMAVCVAWFNPLVWFAAKRGFLDRERACDDRVLCAGFAETEYGQCLLEVAASLSGRRLPGTAAVSMAEPPLKQRLQWILSSTADRRSGSAGARNLLLAVFGSVAVVMGIIRPLATAPAVEADIPAQAASSTSASGVQNEPERPSEAGDPAKPAEDAARNSTQASNTVNAVISNENGVKVADVTLVGTTPAQDTPQPELITITKPVTGLITDENGVPLEGVEVTVTLRSAVKQQIGGSHDSTLRTWWATTDSSGQFMIDISDAGHQPPTNSVAVRTAKSGYAAGMSWGGLSLKEIQDGKEFPPLKLLPGRRVTGNVLSSSGQPVAAVMHGGGHALHWMESLHIDEDGRLEVTVPASEEVAFCLYADDHSPAMISVSPNQTDLGDIRLEPGSVVSGKVLNKAGDPIEGVVVELICRETPPTLRPHVRNPTRVAVSDGDGRFSLGAAAGECVLHVTSHAPIPDRLPEVSVTGKSTPLIAPVELTLAARRENRSVDLRAADTRRIRGTARWDDGTPVEDFEVTGGVSFSRGGIGTSATKTDAEGRYEMILPRAENVYLIGIGAFRDRDRGEWYMAGGSAPHVSTDSGQVITLKGLAADLDDVDNVDWELRVHRATSIQSVGDRKAADAWQKLREALRGEREFGRHSDSEDLIGPYLPEKSVPQETPATSFLKFEEEYRGHREAVLSLVEVIRIGAPGIQREAIDRLSDQYLGHEDLARAFIYLRDYTFGLELPGADDLLRRAAGRSPHPAVRAAALFTRAEFAHRKLRNLHRLNEIEAFLADLKRTSTDEVISGPKDFAERAATVLEQQVKILKAIDPQELRSDAIGWLKIVEKEYGDIPRTDTSGHTFGQDAKTLRFALEHVIVGQQAPPFEAVDVRGGVFSLFEQLGNVVVISFDTYSGRAFGNSEWSTPDEVLVKAHKDQPFRFVNIAVSNSEGAPDVLRQNAKLAPDSVRLIHDPYRGPIQSQWGVTSIPTQFVVDRSGRLRGIFSRTEQTSELVEELLKSDRANNGSPE
ncbi:MAG: hypothetical protein KDA91_18275 [Planctomycetaceae bacterium]|nr:hypothetical protein [Planctomycetaceae bacterium]